MFMYLCPFVIKKTPITRTPLVLILEQRVGQK